MSAADMLHKSQCSLDHKNPAVDILSSKRPIVVSGFEPFGEEHINASWEAVSLLPPTLQGHVLHIIKAPVVFGASGDVLVDAIRKLDPCIVLAVGEAGGRTSLSLERVALNVMQARIPDNAQQTPSGEAVCVDGPAAYMSTLPLNACLERMKDASVPTALSETAGLYVCNQLMYRILHEAQTSSRSFIAGFCHVPYTPQQTLNRPQLASMESSRCATGLQALLEAAIDNLEQS